MTPETRRLIQRLLDGTTTGPSTDDVAAAGDEPALLVARALVGAEPQPLLDRAHHLARTTRDRQLVAIADAHLAGDADRVDALARDHLVDHPDSPVTPVVAWMASHPRPSHRTPGTRTSPPPHQPSTAHEEIS